ncbi:nitrile hydratase subunit beta [Enterovirga sp. DB1703]|uniref:Nitrile hydratase subunit beta n=1 Tax=Enterovirga aerilata TaxID=2730920 RepID=A0A849I416_9HYPH|nr:nitrile hydratase subunit beta [Enterovirga sp. DB1703]
MTDAGGLPLGTTVSVIADWPEERGPCHLRTPSYVRGRRGRIAAHLGRHPNPEDLAFARPAELRRLYHVSIPLSEIWPGEDHPNESLLVELYEHWLQPHGTPS